MRYWTEAGDALLTVLWAEGLASAEIGRRMDTTKNSILGRAHRLRLPTRGSPIGLRIEDLAPGRVAMPGVQRYTGDMPSLPPLKSARGKPAPDAPAPVPRREQCAWPISDDRPWRFCEEKARLGSPYCLHHESIAWVKRPNRQAIEEPP